MMRPPSIFRVVAKLGKRKKALMRPRYLRREEPITDVTKKTSVSCYFDIFWQYFCKYEVYASL